MPRPEKNSVVAGGNPVSSGTRKVAPNIATTCWAPMPIVIGQARRSLGATTEPGLMLLPSPCRRQPKPDFCVLMGCDSPGEGEDKIPSNSTPVEPGVRIVERLLMRINGFSPLYSHQEPI